MALKPDVAGQRVRDPGRRPGHSQTSTDEGAAAAAVVPLLSDFLDDVAVRTQARLGPVAGVAVTLNLDGEPGTVGSSNALALGVDRIQYEVGVGPCLLALREGVGTYVPDLAVDTRWRDYGPRAAASGTASCISAPTGASTTGPAAAGHLLDFFAARRHLRSRPSPHLPHPAAHRG